MPPRHEYELNATLKYCAFLLGCARSEACVHLERVRCTRERQVAPCVVQVGEVVVRGICWVLVTHVDTSGCHVTIGVSQHEVLRLDADTPTLKTLYLFGLRRH